MAEISPVPAGFFYRRIGGTLLILNHISYCFEQGKMYAILGTSGAGKTTLLSLLADEPTKNLDEDTANEIMKKGTVVDTEDITLEEKCVFAMMVLARMLRICKFHKKLIEKAAGTSYNIVRTVQINIDGLADKALEGAV